MQRTPSGGAISSVTDCLPNHTFTQIGYSFGVADLVR